MSFQRNSKSRRFSFPCGRWQENCGSEEEFNRSNSMMDWCSAINILGGAASLAEVLEYLEAGFQARPFSNKVDGTRSVGHSCSALRQHLALCWLSHGSVQLGPSLRFEWVRLRWSNMFL